MCYYIRNCFKPNLKRINLSNLKCGDFLNQKIEDDDNCTIEDDDCLKIFLRGYCSAFAIALNEICGYKIYRIKEGIHYFCKANINKKEIYIDVRGIMDKPEECLDFFDATIDNVILDNNSCYEDSNIKIAVNYAKEIINKYIDYYKV